MTQNKAVVPGQVSKEKHVMTRTIVQKGTCASIVNVPARPLHAVSHVRTVMAMAAV